MKMARSKAQKEIIGKAVEVLDTALKAAKDTASGSAASSLEELKKQYQTVNLLIKKRDPATGQMALFERVPGQQPAALSQVGIDVLCQDRGGGGEYEVFVMSPEGVQLMKLGPFPVMGHSYNIPKSQRDQGMTAQGGQFGMLPAQTGVLGAGGVPTAQITDLVGYMRSQGEIMNNQQQQSGDRMLAMMMGNQQQQQASMIALMTAMQGGNKGSESSEVQALREEIRSMREQGRNDQLASQISQLQQQIADQKNTTTLELLKAQNQDGGKEHLLATVLTNSQAQQQRSSETQMMLVKEMLTRPGEDEKFSNLMNSFMGMQTSQMAMIGEGLQMGLFGGQEQQHPVAEAVKLGLEGLTQIGVAALSRGQEEGVPADVQAPPTEVQEMPPVQDQQMAGLPPGQEPAPVPAEGEYTPDPSVMLTQEELEAIEIDVALTTIIAKVTNGFPAAVVSRRLYRHAAKANNAIARKWLEHPVEIGWQVLSYYNVPETRIEEIIRDTIDFAGYVNGKGDPEAWGKSNAPEPKPKKQAPVGAATGGAAPDVGVTQGEPAKGEEYIAPSTDDVQNEGVVETKAKVPVPVADPEEPSEIKVKEVKE
jgi:hypothetical protein